MEVCNFMESNSDLGCDSLNSGSGKFHANNNDNSETSDSLENVESNSVGESRIDQVPSDINLCHPTSEVPFSLCRSVALADSVCEDDNSSSEAQEYITPDSPHSVKDSLLSKEILKLNNNSYVSNLRSVCEDSDSPSEFLNTVGGSTDKVLLEFTERCDLSSIEDSSCIDIESERSKLSKSRDDCYEATSTETLSTANSIHLSDVLPINNDSEIMCDIDANDVESEIFKSRKCDQQEMQFFDESLKNNDSKSSVYGTSSESQIEIGNNDDSDTISADEKEVTDDIFKTQDSTSKLLETTSTVKDTHHNQQALNQNGNTKVNNASVIDPTVRYKCVYCSFTDKELEKLSSHVLTCVKRQGKVQKHESCDGEPPSKVRVLSLDQKLILPKTQVVLSKAQLVLQKAQVPVTPSKLRILPRDQPPILPKTQLSILSKAQPVVFSPTQVPVTPKTQFILTPQTQLLSSAQTQCAATPKAQFLITSQAQIPGATKTVFAVAPKLVPISNTQLVINPQTQLPVSSKPQAAVSVHKRKSPVGKHHINISPQPPFQPAQKQQPVLTLQTQLPIVSSAQCEPASKRLVVASPQSQFPLAAGTKLTLGPHSQVPIAPQTPLTISPQGLTISQAGTQLLITSKPVQQNAAIPNQPTLLGLGIGTNPTVAPKNIVLLPNVLLNSVSAGKVKSKQTPKSIQGQYILQTATTTPCSVAPMQLQKNLVYTTQSLTRQPQVSLSSLHNVSKNSVSPSTIKTTAPSVVQRTKVSSKLATHKQTKTTTAPASITNSKPVEASGQTTTSLDKYICEICDDYVKDLKKLRGHMQCLHAINIHPKMMPSFNCQKCQFCFFTEQGLERHLVGSHGLVTTGMQEAADKGKDGGRCPICGWGYQNKLLYHVATEHKVCLKPADLSYKCTLCTATFGVYKRFEEHVFSTHRTAVPKVAVGNSQSSSPAIK